MNVKITKIDVGEILLYNGKAVKVGDVIDLPKERANHYITLGKAEVIKTENKKSKE